MTVGRWIQRKSYEHTIPDFLSKSRHTLPVCGGQVGSIFGTDSGFRGHEFHTQGLSLPFTSAWLPF